MSVRLTDGQSSVARSTLWPGIELAYQRHGEYVEGGSEPDTGWKMLDAAGHAHVYNTQDYQYPTLVVVEEGCDDPDHDEDCSGGSHYACKFCGETIQPRMRESAPRFVLTRQSYVMVQKFAGVSIGYEFGQVEFVELSAAVHALVQEKMQPFATTRTFGG